jgi:uncharacterized protein with GYD domain
MFRYITLMNFTEQGLRNIKESVKRADAAQKVAREYGVSFKSIRWVQGPFDIVCELEAPDEQSFAAFGLALASLGNVSAQTLRAFDADEMRAILAKLP